MNKLLSTLGLDEGQSEMLSLRLNELLANYQVLYVNTRGFHWNIKGEKFFELHVKFEELYTDLQVKIDEVAERILTLGQTPFHSYSEYLSNSTISEVTNISDGKEAVASLLKSLEIIIHIEREILDLSGDSHDEGTNALMSDYIREQEKLAWMYSAFLG